MGENSWIIEIKQKLDKLNDAAELERWKKQSIHKIPASITDLKTSAYKPQILSIGPYHHDAEHLQEMEKHKHRALFHFLKRTNKSLEELVELLTPEVEDAKAAYDQLDSTWHENTDKFLKMMILDGCFVLEILRASNESWVQPTDHVAGNDYLSNDPIFSNQAMLYFFQNLKYDMLMFENQIPLFVLEKLGSVLKESIFQKKFGLMELILYFFCQRKDAWFWFGFEFKGCLHILDVHHRSLQPISSSLEKRQHHRWGLARFLGGGDKQGRVIRSSVTALKEAGISIKQNKSRSLTITFRYGVLELPHIVVDDALESLYLNLMAFERFHFTAGNEVTSYVYFMGNIIDNEKDVSLLQSCGIIENVLGSDTDVANLFNSLSSKATFVPDDRLGRVYREVIAYCQKPWPRCRAYVNRYYLTTPYATASVIGASILFVLTVAQTIFTVWPNDKPSRHA